MASLRECLDELAAVWFDECSELCEAVAVAFTSARIFVIRPGVLHGAVIAEELSYQLGLSCRQRGTFLSRDNFLRRNIQKNLEKVDLGWVNFQVLRRTQASLGHKEGLDPKVSADQRGHVIGVAIDTYTESDLESRREAVTKLELAFRKPAEVAVVSDSRAVQGFRGKQGKGK
jgi:hypothetical protein